jgi:hypothetical protein
MHFRPLFLGSGLVLLLLSACTTFDYVGRSYTPTVQVDLYLDPTDIDRPYEVMDMAQVKAPSNFEKLQERTLQEARQKGADAVLVEFMDEEVSETFTPSMVLTTEQKVLWVKLLKYEE